MILSGDDDQIELSLNIYKDGILDRLPVVPNLILDMKEEKHIWRLNQLTLAIHIPLSDPDYVKGIAEDMRKTRQRMAEYGAMTSLQTAQSPRRHLSKRKPQLTPATLLNWGKAGGCPGLRRQRGEGPDSRKDYVFKIADCSSSSFHIVAEPAKNGPARRALCIDDAGTTLFSDDGKGATCISSGRPVKEMEEAGSGRAMGAID